MKNLYKTLMILTIISLFTACGGGGGGTTEGGASDNTTKIYVILCAAGAVGANDCGTVANPYTCVRNGDTLVAQNDSTELEVVHNSEDNKKVCVKDTIPVGSAYILRGN